MPRRFPKQDYDALMGQAKDWMKSKEAGGTVVTFEEPMDKFERTGTTADAGRLPKDDRKDCTKAVHVMSPPTRKAATLTGDGKAMARFACRTEKLDRVSCERTAVVAVPIGIDWWQFSHNVAGWFLSFVLQGAHQSKCPKDLLSVLERCWAVDVPMVLHEGDRSHNTQKEDAFLQVWNEGTPEFDECVASCFKDDKPMSPKGLEVEAGAAELRREKDKDRDRGNDISAAGFSAENIADLDEDGVAERPAGLRNNTLIAATTMCHLSVLMVACCPSFKILRQTQRAYDFPIRMALNLLLPMEMALLCILDGLSNVATRCASQKVKIHFDLQNDAVQFHGRVFVVGRCEFDRREGLADPDCMRCAHIGCFKKTIRDCHF